MSEYPDDGSDDIPEHVEEFLGAVSEGETYQLDINKPPLTELPDDTLSEVLKSMCEAYGFKALVIISRVGDIRRAIIRRDTNQDEDA